MAGDFSERCDVLAEHVGDGDLVGKLEVNQVYAHYQHERMDLAHPNGGQAKFLETALHRGSYFEGIAREILDGGARQAMIDAVEDLDDNSAGLTPKQTTVLARSGHPTVTDNGAIIHDRPPEVPRLSDEELRAIHSRGITIHR